jgi:hypothetical protein
MGERVNEVDVAEVEIVVLVDLGTQLNTIPLQNQKLTQGMLSPISVQPPGPRSRQLVILSRTHENLDNGQKSREVREHGCLLWV